MPQATKTESIAIIERENTTLRTKLKEADRMWDADVAEYERVAGELADLQHEVEELKRQKKQHRANWQELQQQYIALKADKKGLLEALERLLESSPCINNCSPDDMTCDSNFARAAIIYAKEKK